MSLGVLLLLALTATVHSNNWPTAPNSKGGDFATTTPYSKGGQPTTAFSKGGQATPAYSKGGAASGISCYDCYANPGETMPIWWCPTRRCSGPCHIRRMGDKVIRGCNEGFFIPNAQPNTCYNLVDGTSVFLCNTDGCNGKSIDSYQFTNCVSIGSQGSNKGQQQQPLPNKGFNPLPQTQPPYPTKSQQPTQSPFGNKGAPQPDFGKGQQTQSPFSNKGAQQPDSSKGQQTQSKGQPQPDFGKGQQTQSPFANKGAPQPDFGKGQQSQSKGQPQPDNGKGAQQQAGNKGGSVGGTGFRFDSPLYNGGGF